MNFYKRRIVQSSKRLEFQVAKMTTQSHHHLLHRNHIYWTTCLQYQSCIPTMWPTHQRDQKHQMSFFTISVTRGHNVKVPRTPILRHRHFTTSNQNLVWGTKSKAQFLTPKSKQIHTTRLVWKSIDPWPTCPFQHQTCQDPKILELVHIQNCTMKWLWDWNHTNTAASLFKEIIV